jgi:hypothetical protein
MHVKTVIRYFCYLLAMALLLFALWCLLWIASSSSMAFTECANAYELFASNPRCRQPSIAGLLAIASLLGAVIVILVGRRFREKIDGKPEEETAPDSA